MKRDVEANKKQAQEGIEESGAMFSKAREASRALKE